MIEIVFGVLGLGMLIGGKIPQRLFQMLFGKGYYDAKPATARKFGLLLLLTPAPLVILVTALLTALLGGEPDPYVPWAEVIALSAVSALALLWARKFRQPLPPAVPLPSRPSAGEPDAEPKSPNRRAIFIVLFMIVFMLIPFVILYLIQFAAAEAGVPFDWNRYAFLIIVGTGVLAVFLMLTLLLKRRHSASRSQMPVPPPPVVSEETQKDVFEMSDREIRQKLGLEAPDPVPAPPPPDPEETRKWKSRRMLVMVIGILAGMGAPLIILLAMLSDGDLANRSTNDILAIFGICGFALVMAVVMIIFFGLKTKK